MTDKDRTMLARLGIPKAGEMVSAESVLREKRRRKWIEDYAFQGDTLLFGMAVGAVLIVAIMFKSIPLALLLMIPFAVFASTLKRSSHEKTTLASNASGQLRRIEPGALYWSSPFHHVSTVEQGIQGPISIRANSISRSGTPHFVDINFNYRIFDPQKFLHTKQPEEILKSGVTGAVTMALARSRTELDLASLMPVLDSGFLEICDQIGVEICSFDLITLDVPPETRKILSIWGAFNIISSSSTDPDLVRKLLNSVLGNHQSYGLSLDNAGEIIRAINETKVKLT